MLAIASPLWAAAFLAGMTTETVADLTAKAAGSGAIWVS
jgi:hypothetical protein